MILSFKLININSQDWIGLVFITILTILAIVNFIFENRLRKLFYLPFSKSYFSLYSKDNPLLLSAFNSLLFVVNILTYSLLLYFIVVVYGVNVGDLEGLTLFFGIFAAFVVYFIIKFFLTNVFNFLILNVKQINKFSFYKVSFRNFTSLIIIWLLIVHMYSPLDKELSIYFVSIVFTGIFVYGYIFSAKIFLEKNSNSLLHIILYLCALEIAPFLIFGKYVISNLL